MTGQISRLLRSCLLWLAILATPATAADNVSSVKTTALPKLKGDGSPPTLLILGGRPVVLQRNGAAIQVDDNSSWTPLDAQRLAGIEAAGAVGDGTRAVIITRDGHMLLVARAGTRLATQALPALPAGFAASLATIGSDKVAIVGKAPDGSNRLLQLSLLDQPVTWTIAPGWPASGKAAAFVGQAGAYYLTT